MISRPTRLVIAIVIGVLLGASLGLLASYWFVDPIMRLHLDWGDWAGKLPELLREGDPLSTLPIIRNCQLGGGILGGVLLGYSYHRYCNRKN